MSNRIGILTFHHTTNYGATLQAWSLQKFLRQLEITSEIIDYQPAVARSTYRRVLFYNRHFMHGFMKKANFAAFRRRHLSLSAETFLDLESFKAAASHYDTVICGSDEIWNTSSFRGYDAGFFLGLPEFEHVKKYSYAASAGATTSFCENKEIISRSLQSFSKISVRDTATKALLLKECDVEPEIMLDPTLLVDCEELMTGEAVKGEPYMLVYGSLSKSEKQYVLNKARQSNCRIFSIGEFNQFADRNFIGAGVSSWLELLNGAHTVFTTFYHGAIFAWKFGRPLIVFSRPSKTRKIEGFVEELALNSTNIPLDADGDAVAIAYESSNDTSVRLQSARSKAERFLKNVRV
ncbi:polysaccharide pyruvyl transferase family protein [Methylophaga sp.]|uniref:polysaccharide pyruvyl transferase family protein n=1 Tax=Methylophaga sp. TaxID=2024840 RepID=UPI003A8FC662